MENGDVRRCIATTCGACAVSLQALRFHVVPDHGLKADQLDQLRHWGAGLQNDSRAEVAAAGKAISLLVEEIERLHVLMWDRRLSESRQRAAGPSEDVQLSLAARVRRATGFASDPHEIDDSKHVSTPFPQEGPQHPTLSPEGGEKSTPGDG
jgi:hypothetical protein